jgi:hypothetical protein
MVVKIQVEVFWIVMTCNVTIQKTSYIYTLTLFLQVVTPLPSHIPQCKALYDFRMTNDDEEGCLTFNKVSVLVLYQMLTALFYSTLLACSVQTCSVFCTITGMIKMCSYLIQWENDSGLGFLTNIVHIFISPCMLLFYYPNNIL